MEEKSLKEEWAATKSQEGGTSWWSSVAEGLNWIPGKGTRSQRPQLTDPACRKEERIPSASTNSRCRPVRNK